VAYIERDRALADLGPGLQQTKKSTTFLAQTATLALARVADLR
jgi:hypothetical protein